MGQRLTFSLRLNSWRGRCREREREPLDLKKTGKFSLMWHSHFLGGFVSSFHHPQLFVPHITLADRDATPRRRSCPGPRDQWKIHCASIQRDIQRWLETSEIEQKEDFCWFCLCFLFEIQQGNYVSYFPDLGNPGFFSGYFMSGHGRP